MSDTGSDAPTERDRVLREAADWIEQHDPADELSWFIGELREGLRNHPPGSCKDCYTAEQLAPDHNEGQP